MAKKFEKGRETERERERDRERERRASAKRIRPIAPDARMSRSRSQFRSVQSRLRAHERAGFRNAESNSVTSVGYRFPSASLLFPLFEERYIESHGRAIRRLEREKMGCPFSVSPRRGRRIISAASRCTRRAEVLVNGCIVYQRACVRGMSMAL